jgi:hypothetical protein
MNIEKGTILYASWGYSMTLVDFYQVVEVKGKSLIMVEEIGGEVVTGQAGYYGTVKADPTKRTGNIYKAFMKKDKNGNEYIKGTFRHDLKCRIYPDNGEAHSFNKMD